MNTARGLGEAIEKAAQDLDEWSSYVYSEYGDGSYPRELSRELRETWRYHERLLIRIHNIIPTVDSALSVLEYKLMMESKQHDGLVSDMEKFMSELTRTIRIDLRQIREELDQEIEVKE